MIEQLVKQLTEATAEEYRKIICTAILIGAMDSKMVEEASKEFADD